MKKKFLLGLMAMTMCAGVAFGAAACTESGEGGGTSSTPENSGTGTMKFEGDMLYNGFDSVADMYKVSQLYEWNYSPMGKLEVVGKDNFIPVKEETGLTAADVVAMIDALPDVADVTIANKDAVQKARGAYGSLSDDAKRGVTNLADLKALEASEALAGYYTVGDFGGDFVKGIGSSKNWTQYSGNLLDPMKGTAVFTAKGLPKAEFFISLFQDPSVDAGQAGDGIMFWLHPNGNNSILAQNSVNQHRNFNEGKSIESNQTYTFYVTYNVAEDYSKLTVNIRIVSETGDEIVNATEEITSFSTVNFGRQTIESWLKDHENVRGHQTFTVNSCNTDGVSIQNVWTPVKATDYNEPTGEVVDPHDPEDLAPRQGDGALRVAYERGTFTEIFARFDKSDLKGMPVKDLGSFSVKVYNDSADEKQVELSLMKSQHQVLNVDGGKFTLSPYAWTECKVTLDPIIVDYFASDLIGLNIRFQDVTDAVYYVDDLRVQFGKIYTEETTVMIEKVNGLKTEIQKLAGKPIAKEDKENLDQLMTEYLELPQAYRFTVDNYALLEGAVQDYFALLTQEELGSGKLTIGRYDTVLGSTQMKDFFGGERIYTTEEHAPNEEGSWKLAFDGSTDWVTVPLTTIKPSSDEYVEIRFWVKNASDMKRAIYLNWKLADNLEAGYVLPANSEWTEVVYKMQFTVSELNAVSLNEGNVAVSSEGALYIGNITIVTYTAQRVIEQIEALPAWSADYTEADKAAVVAARNAYESLSDEEKAKVTNLSKLTELEGNILSDATAQAAEVKALIAALPAWSADYTDEDKAKVAEARAAYDALSETAKALVDNIGELSELELKIAESQQPADASLPLDFTKNIEQVTGSTSGLAYSHSTAENALKIEISDNGDINVKPNEATEYKEVHVWVKNTTDKRLAFYVDWKTTSSAIGDSVTDGNLEGGYVVPANSGWIELIYTATDMTFTQLNVLAFEGVPTTGALYVSKVQLSNGEEAPEESNAVLDFTANAEQVASATGGVTYGYSETEKALAVDFSAVAANSWVDVNLKPTLPTEYKEIHLFVNNATNVDLLLQIDWTTYSEALGENAGNVSVSQGAMQLKANSGWVEIVYKSSTLACGQFNIHVPTAVTSGALYVSKVEFSNEEASEQPEEGGALLDFTKNADQAKSVAGGVTKGYSATESALEIGVTATGDVNVEPNGTVEYTEVHVWVKNTTDVRLAFYVDWKTTSSAVGDCVTDGNLEGGYVVPANSGWIELVYTATGMTCKQFNVIVIDGVAPTTGALYVSKVELK